MSSRLPRPRSLLVPVLGAVIIAVLALLVRSGAPAAPTPAGAVSAGAVRSGAVTIPISMYAFAPRALTVRVGTRVTWTNHDATAHTATANGGAFDTGTIAPHHSRTIVMRRPGTYPYHCAFHAFMTATIRVVR